MEELDLTQVLKDCPNGTKLYSPMLGEVTLDKINISDRLYPITVRTRGAIRYKFHADGKFFNFEDAECMLFPSRKIRDWSTFKPKQSEPQFEPKQWVLARNDYNIWELQIYSHYRMDHPYPHCCLGGTFKDCIPYEGNEELIGTSISPNVKAD